MIPKLVSALGLLALIAGSSLILMASCDSGGDHAYALNVSPGAPYKIDGKPDYFELSFAGNIDWNITNNTTDDPVRVQIRDFGSGHTGGCPVKFVFGGDGPSECSATQVIAAGKVGTITAERGDSNPDLTTKYEFKFYVNGRPTDPDIEIERDPFSLVHYIITLLGLMLMGVGWWLGRRRV
jgi:hypothetical protein